MKAKVILFIFTCMSSLFGCKTHNQKGTVPPTTNVANCDEYIEYIGEIVKNEQLAQIGHDSTFMEKFSIHKACYKGFFKKDFIDLLGRPDIPEKDFDVSDVWEYYLTEGCFRKASPFKNCKALLLQFNQNDSLMYTPSITLD